MTRSLLNRLVLATAISIPVWGQYPSQSDDVRPGRGVARISVINGEVSVRRGDSGDLVAAAINAPLVVQDRLLTASSSRAEVQFDAANMVRLASNSEVRFAEVEYRRYQLQVALGTVTYRVLRDSDAQVEIDTPNISVRPLKRGVYRITVREDGTSEITVRSGRADIYSPRGSEQLSSGRTMLARGTASDPEFQLTAALGSDEWDRWNESRDHQLERSRSSQYVHRDIYGTEDLDGYGQWVSSDQYGYVWAPRVALGWAPYREGRWTWIDYYGWSWVSYDPWGWAPYHYGRWFQNAGFGWCWYPGARNYSHHYWRPALVAFVGFGGGLGLGIGRGFGHVGWIPLAPFERYDPWYGDGLYGGYRNNTVINNTHIVNDVNVTNIYRNARVNGGITSVDAADFGRGRGSYNRASGADLQNASLVRGQLPVAPDRQSLRLANRDVRTADFPRSRDNRTFFSHRQPAPVDRVPFEQQQQGMERVAQRTLRGQTDGSPSGIGGQTSETRSGDVGSGRRGAAANPSGFQNGAVPNLVEGGANNFPSRVADSNGQGWRRSGQGAVGGTNGIPQESGRSAYPGNTTGSGPANTSNGGWRRFGEPVQSAPSGVRSVETNDSGRVETNGSGRFGSPSRTADVPASRPMDTGRTSDGGGWRRFGDPVRGSGQSAYPSSPPDQRAAPQAAPKRFEQRFPDSTTPQIDRSAPQMDRGSGGSRRQSSFDGSGSGSQVPNYTGGGSYDPTSRTADPYGGARSPYGGSQPRYNAEPIHISPSIVHERSAPQSDGGNFGRMRESRSAPDPGYQGGGGSRGGGGGSAPQYNGGGGSSRSGEGGGGGSRGGNAGGGSSRGADGGSHDGGGGRGGRGR